jgi:hypothetical protein
MRENDSVGPMDQRADSGVRLRSREGGHRRASRRPEQASRGEAGALCCLGDEVRDSRA